VVPDFAESQYLVRAPLGNQVQDLFERVKRIAQGAAMMTDTRVEVDVRTGTSNLLLNQTIIDVLQGSLERVTPPAYEATEMEFASEIAKTFPPTSAANSLRGIGAEGMAVVEAAKGAPLISKVMPRHKSDVIHTYSSDVGDATWVMPTGQIGTVCHAVGTPGHSWQITAQGGMSIGHKGMLYAGKVLGDAALQFMQQPELVQKAQAEFKAQIAQTPYVCPIPAGVKPPLKG
jgi:aminobenzoyl-glutamate utilization protein B